MLRIGVVDFLNAYPLWAALETNPKVKLARGVPSHLAKELFAGHLDCALISSVEYLRHQAGYIYHPDLCIAAERVVHSIRLFTGSPTENFATHLGKVRRIYTDTASRSSVSQLQIVLRELKHDIVLEEISNAEGKIPLLNADEMLLTIGDTALKNMALPSYDLQREYFRLFGRGFVYAIWVYPKGLVDEVKPILSQAAANYHANQSHYLREAQRFGFSTEFSQRYLTQIIQHQLSPARLSDLEFFEQKLNI